MAWLAGYTYRKKIALPVTPGDNWVSPTGFVDPDTAWSNEGNAFDGNTGTAATASPLGDAWSSYLELTHASLYCDKVRVYAEYNAININEISIDVYYSGGWHNIYEGIFADKTWVEKAIGSTQQVTAARVKFYNDAFLITVVDFYEFAFNEVRTLTNYPVMLYLSTSSGKTNADVSEIFDELGNDANRLKIALTASDGTTELPCEIEKWVDADEEAWLHVKVPTILPTPDTDIYLYYDSAHASSDESGSGAGNLVGDTNSVAAEAVWNNNVEMAQHMADGASTSAIYDSTNHDNDGTKKGANEPIETTSGKVANAQDFDGSNDYVGFGNTAFIATNAAWTVEALVNLDDWDLTYPVVFASKTDQTQNWRLIFSNEPRYGDIGFGSQANFGKYHIGDVGIALDTWYHVVVTYNGSGATTIGNYKLYLNGVDTQVIVNEPEALYGFDSGITRIGSEGGNPWDGPIDELRVYSIEQTAAWAATTYDSLFDNLVTWYAREAQWSFTSSVIIGNLVTASRVIDYPRAALVLIGNLVTASRAVAYTRSASVLIGNLVTATKIWGIVKSASVLIGNLVTASRVINYTRSALVIIGNKVTASRTIAYTRSALVLIGNSVTATKSWGIVKSASVIIGNLVAATKSWGIVKSATVLIGILVVASRTIAYTRSATVLIGNKVSASKVWGVVKTSSVLIGVKVAASVSFGVTRSASVLIGVLVTASKSWGIVKSASVSIGNLVSATRAIAYARSATVIIGNLVSADRTISYTRSALVLIGNLVSASVLFGYLRSASVSIGNLVSASRTVAYTRSAIVLIGNLVSATKIWGIVKSASVLIGVLVSASRAISYTRSASVVIGNKVAASRTVAWIRSSSVLIGVKVSASVTHGFAGFRAAVIIGVVATASVCYTLKQLIRVPIAVIDVVRTTIAEMAIKRTPISPVEFWRRIRRCQ